MARVLGIFVAFLRLGLMSFGGPVAHLAYFRDEFVDRRKWIDDAVYAQCIAFSQLLPGPASSQTGMLIGWLRGGFAGAVAAWIGFTLPSAVAMTVLGLGAARIGQSAIIHNLLIVAVAVVAHAIVAMRVQLAPDLRRLTIALVIFATILAAPQRWDPWLVPLSILLCAAFGAAFLHDRVASNGASLDLRVTPRAGLFVFCAFIVLLAGLPIAAALTHGAFITIAARLFTTGSLVFGGGHVVLPLLQSQLASAGIIPSDRLLAGYAAAQAMPGPLFTLSSYAGASAFGGSLGVAGAVVATIAIFAPSFFLLAAAAPFFARVNEHPRVQAALAGAGAGVVGLLAATFVTPIWSSAIHTWPALAAAAVAFLALQIWRVPAWVIVLAGAALGAANIAL